MTQFATTQLLNSTIFLFFCSISSNNDSRMSTPGIQMTSNTPTYCFERTSTLSTNPDGLNHALSQENIRLHQIVQEFKVCIVKD